MLTDIAVKTECLLVGRDCPIENVADITLAQTGQLAFINHVKYLKQLKTTGASAVILKTPWLSQCQIPALVTDNPRLAFARAAILLNPVKQNLPGIATSSVIANSAEVHNSVNIEDNVVIQTGVSLNEHVHIGAGSVIAKNVSIGRNTFIYPNVTIHENCHIGENCIIHSGVVIGTDGFGFVHDGRSYLKIPQLGSVKIGNNVEVGANTTIDRGVLLDTIIYDDVKLDNQIQVAHNVEIGKGTVVSACTGIAGSTKIGENCLIGGCVGIRDNIEITDNVVITGRTFVSSSIKQSGAYSSSVLVDTSSNWRKNVMRFKNLDDIARRIKKLEKKSDG